MVERVSFMVSTQTNLNTRRARGESRTFHTEAPEVVMCPATPVPAHEHEVDDQVRATSPPQPVPAGGSDSAR